MDHLTKRSLGGCASVGFTFVLGLILNGVEYRPNRADEEASVNTVVIRGFPAPNRVMQELPGERGIRRSVYPRHMAALYLLAAPSTPESAREEAIEKAEAEETCLFLTPAARNSTFVPMKKETPAMKEDKKQPVEAPSKGRPNNLSNSRLLTPSEVESLMKDMKESSQRLDELAKLHK